MACRDSCGERMPVRATASNTWPRRASWRWRSGPGRRIPAGARSTMPTRVRERWTTRGTNSPTGSASANSRGSTARRWPTATACRHRARSPSAGRSTRMWPCRASRYITLWTAASPMPPARATGDRWRQDRAPPCSRSPPSTRAAARAQPSSSHWIPMDSIRPDHLTPAKHRHPLAWVPTLYLAQGLPFFSVALVAGLMFKSMGVPNEQIARWTGVLGLAWV
ncbi:conserved hypothetical protein, partial [Ricinus communis]